MEGSRKLMLEVYMFSVALERTFGLGLPGREGHARSPLCTFEPQVISDGGTSLQQGSSPNLGGRLPVSHIFCLEAFCISAF